MTISEWPTRHRFFGNPLRVLGDISEGRDELFVAERVDLIERDRKSKHRRFIAGITSPV
jgi:hypothetical protein